MAISEKTIRVNGRNVHYWEDGSQHGRPILLLHGGFGDAWIHWKEIIPLLAFDYHIIAPDLPGYGQSDPLGALRVRGMVDWLSGLLDALGLDQAVLVGHSFAGLFARVLAAEAPQRVPALILVNGGVIPASPFFAKALAYTPVIGRLAFQRIAASTSARAELTRIFANQDALTDEFAGRAQRNREALGRLMQGLTVSRVPDARNPLIPVLLLWGENDPVTPVWVGENIKKGIPSARMSIIAGCGHMPQIETPDVFATQVQFFLDKIDRTPRGSGILSS